MESELRRKEMFFEEAEIEKWKLEVAPQTAP
jgi:hypothetical protein